MYVSDDEIVKEVEMFQARLRKFMDDAGYNNYELAKALGTRQQKIDRIFQRKSFPEVETLIPISKLLGIRVRDLLDYDTEAAVDYDIQITPDEVALLKIRQNLERSKRLRLLSYAEGLRDGK